MIRDLFNILFIFSLVYIGLRTILDSDDSRTKKMLGMLIAAALLINFSLYIAKVVVDVSNFTTVQIYKTATDGITGSYGFSFDIEENVTSLNTEENSISGAYMQVLSVSGWFDNNVGTAGNVFVYSILALFFLMFLGLVLAYGAIMLIARFIAIIFYLMFSPLMFLGWVLPQFQPYATKWWRGFLGYSFFAPVYVFMLYIGLYSLQQIKNGLNIAVTNSYSKAFTGDEFSLDTFEVFLLFAVGTGFLIGATKVASAMSGGGAAIGMSMADKFGRKFTTTMGARVGKYGAGYLGSAGTGWAARKVGTVMDERSAASGEPRNRYMRAIRSGVLSGETTKFGGSQSSKERGDADKAEARRHSTASRAHGAKQAILDASTDIDRETAVAKADGGTIIEMLKTDTGQNALYTNAGSISDDKMKEIMKSDDVAPEVKKKLTENRKSQVSSNLIEEHHEGGAAAGGTIEDVIHKASTSELKTIGFDTAYENAAILSAKQIEDWKDLTSSQERHLKKKRNDDLVAAFNEPRGADTIFNQFKKDTERSKLPKDILTSPNSVKYLNKNVLTKIVDNDGIEDTDRTTIRRNIETHFSADTEDGKEWRKWFNKNNAGQRYESL